MTQEQAKLTLALVEAELDWLEVDHDSREAPPLLTFTYPTILRALLASQTALDKIHIEATRQMPPEYERTRLSKIKEMARAALLDQGDGDE